MVQRCKFLILAVGHDKLIVTHRYVDDGGGGLVCDGVPVVVAAVVLEVGVYQGSLIHRR